MSLHPDHFLGGKSIVVAGFGIAGSTFVSTLNQLWPAASDMPNITVFEQRVQDASAPQGSHVLTLHGGSPDEGMLVLQRLRRLENIKAASTLVSGYFGVWNEKWKFLSDLHPQAQADLPSSALRINREDLRLHLEDKAVRVPTAKIRWQCTCVAAERLMDGRIRVTVEDSTHDEAITFTQDCDFLIVADGADSRLVASLRPDKAKMEYIGANQIGGISRLSQGLPLPLEAIDTGGMQMSDGENICCIYTPLDNHTVHWAVSRVGPERQQKLGSFTDAEFAALKAEALETGSMFAEPFRTIVEATDPATAFILPAKERQPFAHEASQPGIAFIGDANHVLSLFNLKGADMALADGWDLAEQICKGASLDAAITAYDSISIPRVQGAMSFTHERIRFGHSTGALWKGFKYGMYGQRALGLVGHKYR
ncbi:putative monooxygenase [Xylariales sp. PMI_506]|nr:putative monooxygenase [Xylariales sp. PMI_506]